MYQPSGLWVQFGSITGGSRHRQRMCQPFGLEQAPAVQTQVKEQAFEFRQTATLYTKEKVQLLFFGQIASLGST